MGHQALSFIAGGNAKWYSLWKTTQFLIKLNIFLPHNPIMLLGVYLELNLCPHQNPTWQLYSQLPNLEVTKTSSVGKRNCVDHPDKSMFSTKKK
jgi:hypothetical protein